MIEKFVVEKNVDILFDVDYYFSFRDPFLQINRTEGVPLLKDLFIQIFWCGIKNFFLESLSKRWEAEVVKLIMELLSLLIRIEV